MWLCCHLRRNRTECQTLIQIWLTKFYVALLSSAKEPNRMSNFDTNMAYQILCGFAVICKGTKQNVKLWYKYGLPNSMWLCCHLRRNRTECQTLIQIWLTKFYVALLSSAKEPNRMSNFDTNMAYQILCGFAVICEGTEQNVKLWYKYGLPNSMWLCCHLRRNRTECQTLIQIWLTIFYVALLSSAKEPNRMSNFDTNMAYQILCGFAVICEGTEQNVKLWYKYGLPNSMWLCCHLRRNRTECQTLIQIWLTKFYVALLSSAKEPNRMSNFDTNMAYQILCGFAVICEGTEQNVKLWYKYGLPNSMWLCCHLRRNRTECQTLIQI